MNMLSTLNFSHDILSIIQNSLVLWYPFSLQRYFNFNAFYRKAYAPSTLQMAKNIIILFMVILLLYRNSYKYIPLGWKHGKGIFVCLEQCLTHKRHWKVVLAEQMI